MPVFSPLTIRNFVYFLLGAVSVISLTSIAYGLTTTEELKIIENQTDALKWTGEYQTDVSNPNLQIHTYTKLCKGFYIIEQTPTQTIYTGYGDLNQEYTYAINKPDKTNEISTTTKQTTDETEIPIIDPLLIVSTTTEISL